MKKDKERRCFYSKSTKVLLQFHKIATKFEGEIKMSRKIWQIGEETQYGSIVEREFTKQDGSVVMELVPEFVFHFRDTPKILLNQFAYVNTDDPWNTEFWCTKDGNWDGERKMRTFRFSPEAPYGEATLIETNDDMGDRTFGTVGPIVLVIERNDGKDPDVYVSANEHSMRRFAEEGGIIEAPRQRHDSKDQWAEPQDGSTLEKTQYDKTQIGLLLLNSACIHGQLRTGEYVLARVRGELTVLKGKTKPTLNAPFTWVPVADYLFLSMDTGGQNVVMRAMIARYVPMPSRKEVDSALARLLEWVLEQSK